MPSYSCLCCNRELSDPTSVDRGIGPVCAAKKQAWAAAQPGADKVDLPFDPVAKDISCENHHDGLHFNIYQSIYHHSPSGFAWGYPGSGPADFALNILEMFMRERGEPVSLEIRNFDPDKEKDKTTRITRAAWDLHQQFKDDYIVPMPDAGGIILGDEIRRWIIAKMQTFELAA